MLEQKVFCKRTSFLIAKNFTMKGHAVVCSKVGKALAHIVVLWDA